MAAENPYQGMGVGLNSPWVGGFAITPDDGADLAEVARGIYVGSEGSLQVTTARGDVLVFANVPIGVLPVLAARVWATGTTAGSLIGGR